MRRRRAAGAVWLAVPGHGVASGDGWLRTAGAAGGDGKGPRAAEAVAVARRSGRGEVTRGTTGRDETRETKITRPLASSIKGTRGEEAAGGSGRGREVEGGGGCVDEGGHDEEASGEQWRGRVVVVAKRHGAALVVGRRRETEDIASLREAFAAPVDGEVEDLDVAAARCDFYGVFDGHGCSHVADACRERLHELVAEEMGAGAVPREPVSWTGAMERSFARMDAEVIAGCRAESSNCRCKGRKCDHVGSTTVVAIVEESRVIVANCGDSSVMLRRDGAPVPEVTVGRQ
uniref:protein-serine/threonine phosphatase n=1 Tax=Oryza glumipatula TaxID=40148 RepID=A0A0E0A9U9_9ORYZ